MRKFFGPTGHVTRLTIECQVLVNNILGDPSARAVDVNVPAGHDGQGLPLLVELVGFTGSESPALAVCLASGQKKLARQWYRGFCHADPTRQPVRDAVRQASALP